MMALTDYLERMAAKVKQVHRDHVVYKVSQDHKVILALLVNHTI
jgi:hypothetical protein